MIARIFYWIGRLNGATRWRFSRLHAWLYRKLRGRLAGGLLGRPILLLTTVGSKSGRPHTVPITYLDEGDSFLILASYRSDWFANLRRSDSAEVQVGGRRFKVTPEVVEDAATREDFRKYYPALTTIEGVSGDREVPLVRLHRVATLTDERA